MVNEEGIKNPERFLKAPLFSKDEAVKAMDYVAEKTRENINDFTDKFPSSASSGLMYGKIDNNDWTNGFFTGLLWLCYEYTGEIKFKKTVHTLFADCIDCFFFLFCSKCGYRIALGGLPGRDQSSKQGKHYT